MKIGVGIDYHCLVEGRALVLGGIAIPHHKGLEGHSDADVMLHAIADAILGALALGDIGQHFPNTDMRWKNVSSSVLLRHVIELMMKRGYVVGNVDTMLSIESPKIAPYILQMRTHIAGILGVEVDAISVKATTAEGLGFVGREEGVSAHAVVLLQPM